MIEKKQIGTKRVWPFTIPSGIITTQVSCINKIAKEIEEIGILTTKSIGPEKKEGNREPILTQYMPGCFLNAVGLTNPGAEEFARQLSSIKMPEDKFLLVSIFGKNADEFVYVAKKLENFADGFELNLSCPHAKGYGMQLGQDPEVVEQITRAVVAATKKPVFAKLTPNASNIGDIACAAIKAGALGLVAINTVGPGCYMVDGNPVLTNKNGGVSGKCIMPIGVKVVKEIRDAVGPEPIIIGMGGISTARDIEAYEKAGANFFGIGSSLAGMKDIEIKNYFSALVSDLNTGRNSAAALLKDVDMNYKKVKVTGKLEQCSDFKLIKTEEKIEASPGQFVFAWIPGVGEKPLSIMDDDPLILGVLERGLFTSKFNSLQKGDSFYIRGPYGKPIFIRDNSNIVLVGGGCGVAGLFLLAKKFSSINKIIILLGAKDKKHLFHLDEFGKYGEVYVATEDGSSGEKGLVTDLLKKIALEPNSYFFNCGSRAMIEAVLPLELGVSPPDRVYSSADYMTSCGVGICGKCADERGRRTCVEGPFMPSD